MQILLVTERVQLFGRVTVYQSGRWETISEQTVFPENGNVGIGTVNPGQKLEVNGNIYLNNGLSGNGQVGPQLIFNNTFGTTGPNKVVLYNNGINWAAGLGIKDNTFTLHSGGNFQFYSGGTGQGSDGTPTVTVLANGNVGIGTTAPEQKLDVHGNAIVRGDLISTIADPNIGGRIQLNNPAKTANGAASSWQIFNLSGAYGNSLQFWAYDNLGCSNNGLCSNRFTLMDNGNVGIGTAIPNSKLAVNGNIRAHEIKVETANWPDYVFSKDYHLPTLQETEKHIKENGHLSGIPSAAEVKANGIDLGEMNAKLLQKIEELTLHLIRQQKEIEQLKKRK